MITRRVMMNLCVFLALAALLVFMGTTQFVLGQRGGRTLSLDFADAAGLAPRNDVTMRGIPVGAVKTVTLTTNGLARVVVALQPGVTVPQGTRATITRRSPIGDLTLELSPGPGPPLPNFAHIPVGSTTGPPDPELTIAALANVLHAVPPSQLGSLVSELATALRGRADDLASLSQSTADLPQRILQVQNQLRALIETGPKVTGVLADNSQMLASDFAQTAALADILRDRRYDLLRLMTNGDRFVRVANGLIVNQKPNLACLITDFGTVNATLAQSQHLQDLKSTLDLNHYFFDAVWLAVQPGPDHLSWFRVHLLPPTQAQGRAYPHRRPPPNVYAAPACTSVYGRGVGPGSQPGPLWLANGSTLVRG